MPTLARALLRRWLSLFDVTPCNELQKLLTAMARHTGAHLRFDRLLRDYTQYAVLTLPRNISHKVISCTSSGVT
jgi:S-adenosylmethionine-diacylgycerolhomoserine-N-methlytransferase